jgi:D-glycero-alpha-D-manno-heptose 1-phosphate guanylyltransferase
VVLENNKVICFDEKKFAEYGLINGGIYIARKNIFFGVELTNKFSFERDFLENKTSRLFIAGFLCDQYFIDIGIPEDYARAVNELPHWILYGQ